jgi:hypothetical protein
MSSPSVDSTNTKTSKASESSKPKEPSRMPVFYSSLNFYPKNINNAFMPKLDFEGYRQEAKKQYEGDENIPNLLDEFSFVICHKVVT